MRNLLSTKILVGIQWNQRETERCPKVQENSWKLRRSASASDVMCSQSIVAPWQKWNGGWWVCSVFEKDIFSEVNALLKYRKVGRNQMFFHCSYCVQKEYYPYEIHLFSENRLLHVVILLDTISGCSSDFIHRSIEKCPPFRLRMMSKATACPVAHWRTAPTTRCLAHISAICRKKHRSKKNQTWGQLDIAIVTSMIRYCTVS